MPQYGEVRVDFITYTTGVAPNEGNVTVPISGLINAPTFSGDVVIEGDLTVSGLSTFSGITVTGDATIGGDLTVSGNINASSVTISGITGLFTSGTEAAPSISFVGDQDTGFYNAAANEVRITTNGNDRLTVDDAGLVGIGTTDPAARLNLGGNSNTALLISSTTNTGSSNIYFGDSDANFRGNVTYDHSTDSLRFATKGITTPDVLIDSSGRLLVGTTSSNDIYGASSALQVFGTNFGTASISVLRTGDSAGDSSAFYFARQRSTGIVQNGDRIGLIAFAGRDTTDLNTPAATIEANVDGTPGADDMPGRLVFSVTEDGNSSPTERLRINNSGAIGLSGANFGSAGQVLVSNGSSAAPTWEQITPSAVFGWDHDDDTYGLYLPGTSIKVSDLTGTVDIDVQSRMRRCVINNSGVVQYYLDADDSDLKSGDWLRIVETEALDTAYTGTISESTNSLLRVGVPAWAAGTFTLGQRVTHNGSLWECIAATTTATPAAGTVASDLTGTDGQVVVEVPAFSVRYGFLNGVHTREVRLGCSDSLIAQGFQPHPAFIKTDGSYKDAFYIGAYHTYDDAGTGSSVSGQTNTRSQTRATFRTEAEARGTGWHVLSYLELAAIQTLLVCEFQDYNSQKVIGNGSDAGTTYGVTTGQSDGDGNHSVNSTDNASVADDYMAYRGIENLYGRAWQFVDGINVYERVVYLTNDQTAFDDDTADSLTDIVFKHGYEFYAQVPTGSSSYQKELHPLPDVFLPSVVTGASSTTYLGDAFWSSTGWRVAAVGGRSADGARVGAFCLDLADDSGRSSPAFGSRLCYATN